MEISERELMKIKRERKKLTLTKIAKVMDISVSYLSQIEHGLVNPAPARLDEYRKIIEDYKEVGKFNVNQ
ncbi:helix-turn-helix domain-containing protein [Paraliobacillus sp. X-1268]|uniref:helix-turn-helix domain-containing protein n=1 Tax=Paraliobacillus sp. X-1268 TaxID=2213193 RepID=UPI000E3ED415|nr:helix-turn-helix transcriptional regulator [Paraliobacillus sp. X-1268]